MCSSAVCSFHEIQLGSTHDQCWPMDPEQKDTWHPGAKAGKCSCASFPATAKLGANRYYILIDLADLQGYTLTW